ncbi:endoribonuclease YbeY [Gammaproteobacteria bacterium]
MSNLAVKVQYAVARDGVPTANLITSWVKAAVQQARPSRSSGSMRRSARGMQPTAEVTVRVVGEKEIADLNHHYRHKDGPTNVLSFGYDAPPNLDIPLLGDLVVCAPVAAREAVAQGKAPEAHWAHLVVHGTLHLLGLDHEEPTAATTMETLEIQILAKLGYPDPYQEAGLAFPP